MKKMTFIFTIILLFSAVSMFSMAKKPGVSAVQDTFKLRLLEPSQQNILIDYTDINKRIYFVVDFVLSKQDVIDHKLSFILNSDFIFSDVVANKVNVSLRAYKNVGPQAFEPSIDPEVFAKFNNKCKIYEFVPDDLLKLSDPIQIRLKYHIPNQDSLGMFQNNNGMLTMRGDIFWYPRNLNNDENVALTVKTTDLIAFSLDGKAMDYTMKQSYLKEYKHNFTDLKAAPATVIFKRKS
jgi:hypothetical protein